MTQTCLDQMRVMYADAKIHTDAFQEAAEGRLLVDKEGYRDDMSRGDVENAVERANRESIFPAAEYHPGRSQLRKK